MARQAQITNKDLQSITIFFQHFGIKMPKKLQGAIGAYKRWPNEKNFAKLRVELAKATAFAILKLPVGMKSIFKGVGRELKSFISTESKIKPQ